MFAKLNRLFDINCYTKEDCRILYKRAGLYYFNVSNFDEDLVMQVIPEENRRDFTVSLMEATGDLLPHIDIGVVTSINFYIKASGFKTQMYKLKQTELNVRVGITIPFTNVEPTESFIASDGEAWVLDVSIPHSVQSLNTVKENRIAIVLQTNLHHYNDVLEMLRKTSFV